MKRVIITVSGKVQGVCFRRFSQQQALTLGLTGYAKNNDNGKVSILLQGGGDAVDKFVAWVETGVPQARVDDLLIEDDEADDIYLDFSIL
ncbi:acylphosphatase [Shewanella sp. Isolate11]|uniref:acylphosphatase n=1 Tax=Shewanella sp. Isolate11 TaxID=2908530 RepID=UPI001EFD6E29|nr:acylphosphatase [Shewanella sp. Isolate11]MCG9696951.1 acylphosphatase [Shewanella sp. Isolate11]